MAANKRDEKDACDISDLMETFGKYQIIQYLLICLSALFVSMISINFVFTVGDVDYRCQIDECEDANSTAKFPSWWPDNKIDRCSKPVLKTGEVVCTNTSFTGELTACDRWIYESNNTVVSELNLACQPWKSNMVGTIHNMGMMVSMIVSGWMSDKFGRKPTLLFCVVGGSIGQIKTFSTSYYMYIVIEFLEASITGGTYAAACVILLEIAGKKYRVLSGVIFAYAIYCGESLFVCIAMLVPYWKTLVRIVNGPCLLSIFLFFFINESPRWQLVSGRIKNAKKILNKIAKYNKINIDKEELDNMGDEELKEKFDIKSNEIEEGFTDAMKSKEMIIRLLVSCMCRFSTNFVYYGLMINSVWLPGDKYVNFLLSTLMSFPGELISLYLMNKIGRKFPLLVGFIICGILCIISAFVPAEYLWAKLTLFLLGKVIISACFTGAITYAMELFPTSVRGSLLGMASFASQMGAMLAPLTPILNDISPILPFTLFGCSAILTGLLLFLTPETKDLPLFDTIKQVEHHHKGQVTVENDAVVTHYSLETFTTNS